jgi:YD repeat-containing protein
MNKLLVFGMLILSFKAFGVVDMKNANFSNSWVDLEVPGTGYDLKISRTYNSKSLFDGLFGYGWCSDFETTLNVTAEGNIKLTECGAGQEVFFTPREFGRKDIDKTVSQIIAKVKAAKHIDAATLKKMAADMVTDADLRAKFARSYKVTVPIHEGSRFYANGRGVENIQFAHGYYTRYLPDGSYMRFNAEGRMTYMYDKNSNYLKITWDKDTVRDIVDNNGRQLNFKYYNNKKVKSIAAPGGVNVEYKYENLDDLAWVKNAWNNTYNYTYDDTHNMTKATYPDKTFIELTYDKKNDWVTSFQDREKCLENYKYEFDEHNPKNHYWSLVKKTCGKDVVNESKHEFWYQTRADGQVYLSRVASTVNGNVTDISYHEIFGKPISIRKNSERYTFTYYPNGEVKDKVGEFTRLTYTYDKTSGKIAQVVAVTKNQKGKVAATRKTEFKYDKKGNLIWAGNSDGQKVTMTYDNRGRISTITDQAKKVVKIQYEERFGKPSIVTRPGLGTIQVFYKSNGKIDKVKSAEGPTVAMQVASTFNNLLDVIAPATAEIF